MPGISIAIKVEKEISADELEQILLEHVALEQQKVSVKQKRNVKIALVINAYKAYYFDADKAPELRNSIPSGGVLLDANGKQIANNSNHYL